MRALRILPLALLVVGCIGPGQALDAVEWPIAVAAPFDGAAAQAALRALGWPSADGYEASVGAQEGAWTIASQSTHGVPWTLLLGLRVPFSTEDGMTAEEIAAQEAARCADHAAAARTFARAFAAETGWDASVGECRARVVVWD